MGVANNAREQTNPEKTRHDKYSAQIEQNIDQAKYLTQLVEDHHDLELLAPTSLNIVNFRYIMPPIKGDQLNDLNREILMRLHESGSSAPSSTLLNGHFSIRVAICNHRSRQADFDNLVLDVVKIGKEIMK